MLKAEIKEEVIITNKEIAKYLCNEGSLFDHITETLEDMLYFKYKMDYDARCAAVAKLTKEDYVQIFKALADKIVGER